MRLSDPAFRAIFEDAPFGIAVVDRGLKIVDVNDAYCEMLGYTEAEMLRLSTPEITHPEDRQRDAEFLPLLLSGALPRYRAEKRYVAKSGAIVLCTDHRARAAGAQRGEPLRLQHGGAAGGDTRGARGAVSALPRAALRGIRLRAARRVAAHMRRRRGARGLRAAARVKVLGVRVREAGFVDV